jgi:hypothetical protein
VHSTMKRVSQATSASTTPGLALVANAFVTLQEARHQADYDFARSFTKFEAMDHIARARDAIAQWPTVQATPDGERFLVELLVNRLDPT